MHITLSHVVAFCAGLLLGAFLIAFFMGIDLPKDEP